MNWRGEAGKWNDVRLREDRYEGIAEAEDTVSLLKQDVVVKNWSSPGRWADVGAMPRIPGVIELGAPRQTHAYLAGSLQTMIEPAAVVAAGARWRVDGSSWLESGRTVTGLQPGSHAVEMLPARGWLAPEKSFVNVPGGETRTTTATYNEIPR